MWRNVFRQVEHIEVRDMGIAMWQFKISMKFHMKLYFEQIFQVYKFCLGLVLLK